MWKDGTSHASKKVLSSLSCCATMGNTLWFRITTGSVAAVKAELFTMRFTEESGRYSVVTCKNRRSPVRRFLQYTTFSSFVGFVTCL